MLLLRQLKWLVAPGFTPAPVLPVMAFTMMSSFSIRCLASGSSPNCMQVAKQPGLATCFALQVARRFSSGKPSMTLWLSRNFLVSPCAVQKNSTSISSNGSWSVNTKSVSPYSPSCTSVILLPALLELFMNTISASGWLSSKRISSPAVYPAPPMIPTLIMLVYTMFFICYISFFLRER